MVAMYSNINKQQRKTNNGEVSFKYPEALESNLSWNGDINTISQNIHCSLLNRSHVHVSSRRYSVLVHLLHEPAPVKEAMVDILGKNTSQCWVKLDYCVFQ